MSDVYEHQSASDIQNSRLDAAFRSSQDQEHRAMVITGNHIRRIAAESVFMRAAFVAATLLFFTGFSSSAFAQRGGDPPTLPKDPPRLPGDPPTLPKDPPRLPSDPPTLPKDPPALPRASGPRASRPGANVVMTSLTQDLAKPELVIDAGGFLSSVSAIAISPDGRMVAVAGGKVVRIIDAATGEVVKTLRGDRARTAYGHCNGVAFSPDGQFLLVGVFDDGAHGSIRMYRTSNLDQIDRLLPGMNSPCGGIRFSRDGRYMATVDRDGGIVLWDWPKRSVLKRIPPLDPNMPIIDALQFADSEPYLMAFLSDGPHIYKVPDGVEVKRTDYVPPRLLGWMFDILMGKVAWPYPTARDPRTFQLQLDRNVWAAAGMGTENGGSRPWVALYRPRTMDQQAPPTASITKYTGHRWQVEAVAVSPGGAFVVSGDKFGEVHLWDAKTGQLQHKVTSQGKPIYEAVFSDSNDRIAYSTTPDLANWKLNNYGILTHILDLKQRTIQQKVDELAVIQETPELNGSVVKARPPSGSEEAFHMVLQTTSGETQYRIPTGRIPSCFTLLEEPKLGVAKPVLFADNLNYLALWDTSGDELKRAYRGHDSMVTSISPSSNGRIFVTGSTDRTIRIWSLLDYKPTGIFDFKYENSTVIKVRPGSSSAMAGVRPGDRFVSMDGHSLEDIFQMMLYDRFNYQPGQMVNVVMERGTQEFNYAMKLDPGFDYVEPLLNIFIGDNDQWVIWTPQGYYDCSPGADRLIGWHVNQGPDKAAKFFQAQQFRQQLYRPDIINRILQTGNVASAVELANQTHFQKPGALDLRDPDAMSTHAPPVVTIQSPETNQSFTDPRVEVVATVRTGNGLPIKRVTLMHNGTAAEVFRPKSPAEGQELKISQRLKLFPGRNEIAFIAENTSATSSADASRIVLTAPASATRSKVYVLSIGIAEYAMGGQSVENLKFAARDASAFADVLQKHDGGKLYSKVEAKVLLNKDASRSNILDGLQWLVDNVQAGDVAVLFCSAHGFLDDRQNFYVGTHGVDPERLRATAVSWREVVDVLHEDLPACKRLVFLDACHAEGIGSSAAQNPLHDLAAPELGTIFYASCTLQQKSFEREEWSHGAFTKAILDVLSDGKFDISPSNGLASTAELELGVREKVTTMTRHRQQPQVFSPSRLRDQNLLEFDQ